MSANIDPTAIMRPVELSPKSPAVGTLHHPLRAGDHLSRDEFERRYSAMPNLKHAELIEGVVYVTSPVSNEHGEPHSLLGMLLGFYAVKSHVISAENTTIRLDIDNEPQPDSLVRIPPNRGGQARVSDDNYIEGAPELIAEIANSSSSYDLYSKKNVYRRNGVREYIVWRTLDQAIDWFILQSGEYVPLPPGADGIYRSEIFPGLWLDTIALLAGDRQKALATLEQGIASPEHAAFVERLNANDKG